MKSITKYGVTENQIKACFKAAGIDEIIDVQEISDGWYNSVFSAKDTSGKKYVIKIAPEKNVNVLTHEHNIMASEVKFYSLLKEKTAIKIPRILFSDFTEKVIPTAYFIMEFLEGERLDKVKLSADEKEMVSRQWAWILTEFHKIEGAGYGYEQTSLTKTWKEALTYMTQILIGDAAFFGKRCKIGEKLITYIEKFSASLENVPCVLVNFDLHAKNLFCQRTSDGGIELAVLDLERCFFGDRIGDFIMPEMMADDFAEKNIVKNYNLFTPVSVTGSRDEQIRYYLLMAYLAVIMYTERFSRFKSAKKFFSSVYLAGTAGYMLLAKKAFSALKKIIE